MSDAIMVTTQAAKPKKPRVLWMLAIATLLFGYFSFFFAMPYLFNLVCSFVCFLAACHFVAYAASPFPKKFLSYIDYIYLSVAATAIFFFAFERSREIDELVAQKDKYFQERADAQIPKTMDDLSKYIGISRTALCATSANFTPTQVSIAERYCLWSKEIYDYLMTEPTGSDVVQKAKKFQTVAEQDHMLVRFPFPTGGPFKIDDTTGLWPRDRRERELGVDDLTNQLDRVSIEDAMNLHIHNMTADHSNAIVRSLQIISAEMRPTPVPPTERAEPNWLFVFARMVGWPFVVSFAFAIRITKTTAELNVWGI